MDLHDQPCLQGCSEKDFATSSQVLLPMCDQPYQGGCPVPTASPPASTSTSTVPSCPLLMVPEKGPSRPRKNSQQLMDMLKTLGGVGWGVPMMSGLPGFEKVLT